MEFFFQQCGMAHYFGKYKECAAYLKEANDPLQKCEYKDFLIARAKIYHSAIYREKKKFDESMKCLLASKKVY
jgi:hypothetical protein